MSVWRGMSIDRCRRAVMSRPRQFVILGALTAMCAAFGSTMAASLFLANAGARGIPLYYILFSVVSIPASVVFSGIIDRWPRRTTMTLLLVIYATGAMLASLFIGVGAVGYFVLYVTISVVEIMMYSVYYTLFSDHFNVGEAKRHGGAMTIALGVGAAIGSLMISALTEFVEPRRVFLVLPLLVGITLAHLLWLTRREEPLDEVASGAEEGLIESLKALPRMSWRYPVVLFMAASMFLNIVGQCIMEFEAFSIYARSYPNEGELAAFLGWMTAVVDIVGILCVFFIFNPLIARIGVARTNLVAPATNLVSFLILAVSSSLPAGVLAHLNYYPLEHSLHVPAFLLVYNAVPRRFVGRVRVSNDGIIYPLALAASGLLLLLVEDVLSLSQVAMIGAGGAILYLLIQGELGRQYVHGLLALLRSGSVELDQVNEGFQLPDDYVRDILGMLRSEDRDVVVLGVELAARCDTVLAVADVERALSMVPDEVGRSALTTMSRRNPARVDSLMASTMPRVRAMALEARVVGRPEGRPALLRTFLDDDDESVRAVAAAGLLGHGSATTMARDILLGLTGAAAVLAALRVLRALAPSGLSSVLEAMSTHGSAEVRAEALAVAGGVGDAALAGWARRAVDDPNSAVRAAAVTLLARVAAPDALARVCHDGFADRDPEVRRAVARALGRRGGRALEVLCGQLRGSPPDVVGAVMEGVGAAGAEVADTILFDFLAAAVFPTVTRNLEVAGRLPSGRAAWRSLEIALADSNARAVHTVLHALGVLGYQRILGLVRTAITTGESRTRANAIEALSSLAHRRYVVPLLPFFDAEPRDRIGHAAFSDTDARGLLSALCADDDPFIAAAAMTAWDAEFGGVPDGPSRESSALVAATRRALGQRRDRRRYDEEPPMNRLVFLKSVPLFSSLTLDHLMAVDAALLREPYLPSERIVREGDLGDKLFIIFKGEVAIRKRVSDAEERELARLTTGQLFGEMALFDDERRSATAVAVTDAELLSLDREHFHSLAYQRPDIPIQLCKVLVARLRTAIS
jgi:HEAT repeat protein/MFS family permease